MAKKSQNQPKVKNSSNNTANLSSNTITSNNSIQNLVPEWIQNIPLLKGIIFMVAFVLYANTLLHDYTQDDAIVIYDNMFTTKGVEGIPGILSYDTFYGFFKEQGKAQLVAGGRYRPFTLVMFAIEWQIFGRSPFIGHLINVILFGFTCIVLFTVLRLLLKHKIDEYWATILSFIATLLFVCHPIHTEVVANIKGRDEIISLLGSLGALYFAYQSYFSKSIKQYVFAFLCLTIALFSKENAITFVAIIPLSLWFFVDANISDLIKNSASYLLAAVFFIAVRGAVIGFQFGGTPMELMNNPFIKIVNNQYVPFSAGEKLATIFYTLGKYVQLLIFPHPLTHDYYPRHIGIMTFGDMGALLSLILYIGLAYVGIVYGLKRKNIYGYCALFFLITLSIVSNLVFPIGTNMSERFMFMPSIAFCLALAYAIVYFLSKFSLSKLRNVLMVSLLLLLAYSAKTFTRNFVWKNDFTLFTTDVNTSVNSAKLQNAAGGALFTASFDEKDPVKQRQMLTEAVDHLNKALQIHPNYKNAYLLLGNCSNKLEDYENAIIYYKKALSLDPAFKDAINNLGITYRDAGRYYGEKKGDLPKAIQYLEEAYKYRPNEYEVLRLLGIANGIGGNHAKAISYFAKALELEPKNADAMFNLGTAYISAGDSAKGLAYQNQARSIDPKVGMPKSPNN